MNTEHYTKLEKIAQSKGKEIRYQEEDTDFEWDGQLPNEEMHVDMEMIDQMLENFADTIMAEHGDTDPVYLKMLNLRKSGSDADKIRLIHTPEDHTYYFSEDLEQFAQHAREGAFDSKSIKADPICRTYCDVTCYCRCYGPFGNEICRQACQRRCYRTCSLTFTETKQDNKSQ